MKSKIYKVMLGLVIACCLAITGTGATQLATANGSSGSSASAGTTYYPAHCQYSWTEYWGGFYSPVLGKYIPRQVWAVHYVYRAWWEPNWLEYLQGKRSGYITVKRVQDNFYPYSCPRW